MTRLWLRAVLNQCAWLFAMTFAMAMDMATPRPLHWLWLYPQPLPWDLASIALLRVLFLCNLLGICMVDDGGDVFGSLRLDMGRLA